MAYMVLSYVSYLSQGNAMLQPQYLYERTDTSSKENASYTTYLNYLGNDQHVKRNQSI